MCVTMAGESWSYIIPGSKLLFRNCFMEFKSRAKKVIN